MMMMMMMMMMKKNKIIEKKAKGTKKCVIKRRRMLKNYKDCLFNDKTILRSQQRDLKAVITKCPQKKLIRSH